MKKCMGAKLVQRAVQKASSDLRAFRTLVRILRESGRDAPYFAMLVMQAMQEE